MTTYRLLAGDVRETLATLPEASVQCCVTSPPYWGLRDYGTATWEGGDSECDHTRPSRVNTEAAVKTSTLVGSKDSQGHLQEPSYRNVCGKCGAMRIDAQLGLEPTPDVYVANLVQVFREVRRVLKDDGTLWLNLGDSYASDTKGSGGPCVLPGAGRAMTKARYMAPRKLDRGVKPKDLVGIPWSVAKALQSPYYTGQIARERDRVWLAATIDAEGTICGFRHERADDGRIRTGVHVTITNASTALLDEAHRIWPASRSEHQRAGDGHLGKRDVWRWIAHGAERKASLLAELYPYLIVKRRQALIAWNLLQFVMDGKRLGRGEHGPDVRAKRDRLVAMLSDANAGRPLDVPSWCDEPPSLTEPGWYLRSDIIWHKPNPMPESVTDRPTKSHEYIFLLTKSASYYYDAAAIAEQSAGRTDMGRMNRPGRLNEGGAWKTPEPDTKNERNKRTVWTVATQPYSGAHFATFPEALIDPCILAGSREGDTVLDTFNGTGTTGAVSVRHRRHYIGCELNPEYIALARERIGAVAPLFAIEQDARARAMEGR